MITLYKAKISDFSQADYAKTYSLLDCASKEKIDKQSNEKDKKLSLAGRILLRSGIEELYNKSEFEITYNEHGKPLCDFCYFNISHSGDRVVCVVSDLPVGVDLQQIRPIKPRKEYKFFSDDESCYVNQDSDISKRYIEIFAKKESAIKMLGLSLANSDKVDIFSQEFNFETTFIDDYILAICTPNI